MASILYYIDSICIVCSYVLFFVYPLLQQISFWPYLLIPILVVGVIAIITLLILPFCIHSGFSSPYEGDGHDYAVVFFIIAFCWLGKCNQENSFIM